MRVHISPLFILYIGTIALLSSWQRCICLIAALLLHEIAHCLVAWICRERIATITLAPFGGMIVYDQDYVPKKGIIGFAVALAGPLCSYVLLTLSIRMGLNGIGSNAWMREFAVANLGILLINVLPVLPLDGGRALFCVGYYFFQVSRLSLCLAIGGMITGFLMIAAGIYGFALMRVFNLSLLIGGVYLIVAARRNHMLLMEENRYVVLSEIKNHQTEKRKTIVCSVNGMTRLLEGFHFLGDRHRVLFSVEQDDGQIRWMSEKRVIDALLKQPDALFKDICN